MREIIDISDWLTVLKLSPETRTVVPFIMTVRVPVDRNVNEDDTMDLIPCWLEPFLMAGVNDERARSLICALAAHTPRKTYPEQTIATWLDLPPFMPFGDDRTYGRMATAERFPGGRLAIAKRLGITFWTILPPPATP